MSSFGRDAYDDEDEENLDEEIPVQVDDLSRAPVPNQLKGLRACKRCGLIKTYEQFYEEGCENCPFLEMAEFPERANSCTTPFFEGMSAVADPRESWAARWIRVDQFVPGVYAITVTGTLDQDIQEDLGNRGIRWRCRPHNASN